MSPSALDRLLADFRAWLETAPPDQVEGGPGDEADDIDLATIVGQFVALRHEVNLQTRSSRAQVEQSAQTLDKLTQTLALLERQQNQGPKEQAQEETLRPVLRALVDLHDALSLAEREVQRVQAALDALLEENARVELPAVIDTDGPPTVEFAFPWWARLLGLDRQAPRWEKSVRAWWEQRQETAAARQHALDEQRRLRAERSQALAERIRQSVQSILTGYAMSLQRVERALEQQGLEVIDAEGESFDPELMEVLEAVHDTGRPAGEVVGVVRRGYRWRGRVFRFAQVKVARS